MALRCDIPTTILKDGVKAKKVTASGKGRKKPMLFDVSKITNDMIYDIAYNRGGKAIDVLMGLKGMASGLIKNNEIYKKIFKNYVKSGKNNLVLNGIEKTTDPDLRSQQGNVIKMRSVALDEILGSIESETNVETNIGLNDEGLKGTLRNKDGSRKLNGLALAQTIGKILAEQHGFKLYHNDPALVNSKYAELGWVALRSLEEAGIIRINSKDTILNPGYYDNELQQINKGQTKTLDGYPTVSIVSDAFLEDNDKGNIDKQEELNRSFETGELDTLYDNDIVQETVNGVKAIKRMVVPTNFNPPITNKADLENNEMKPKTKDLGFDGGSGITEDNMNLMEELQSKETMINPIFNSLFMAMHNELLKLDEIDPVNPESTLKNLYKAIGLRSPVLQNKIFGSFIGSTPDDFKSKIGQSISKENPLMQMLMFYPELVNEDGSSKPYYHQLGLYRTTRMEYISTFMNEQMSKNARYMATGNPVTIFTGSNVYSIFLQSIMDRSGLNRDQIETKGYDPVIDQLLDEVDKAFGEKGTLKDQIRVLEYLARGKIGGKSFDIKGSPIDNISILHAISEIRNQENGEITTINRAFLDAKTSGITLTFFQAVGKDTDNKEDILTTDNVFDMLSRLGIAAKEQTDPKKNLDDAYHILLNAAKEAKAKGEPELGDAFDTMAELAKLGLFQNVREISKPMTMVTNYQAGEITAVLNTAAELRQQVTDYLVGSNPSKETVDYIKKMIKKGDKQFYKDNDIANKSPYQIANTPGVNHAIEAWFIGDLVPKLRTLLDKELEGTTGKYKKRINTTYSHISDAYMDMIKNKPESEVIPLGIIPPMAYLTMTEEERTPPKNTKVGSKEWIKWKKNLIMKYGMPLTSRRQAMVVDPNGNAAIVLKEVPNALTASVNAIHAIDAAIMFYSHEATLKKMKEDLASAIKSGDKKLAKQLRTSLSNASGMIHDQNNADPVYSSYYQSFYNHFSREVSKEYDIERELAETYMLFKGETDEFSQKLADKLYNDALERESKKKYALGMMKQDQGLFGYEPIEVPHVPKETFDANKKEEPTDVVEQDFSAEEMITSYLNVKDAKTHHKRISDLKTSEGISYIVDVETTGYLPDGEPSSETKEIKASTVFQISLREVKDGKPTGNVKTIYFPVTKISDKVQEVTQTTGKEVKAKAKAQGNDTFRKAWEDFINHVDGNPLIGFNSNFDMQSIEIMMNKYGDLANDVLPDLSVNDVAKAFLFQEDAQGKHIPTGEGKNTLIAIFDRVATKEQKAKAKEIGSGAHDADTDTYMTEVIFNAIDPSLTENDELYMDDFDAQRGLPTYDRAMTDDQFSNMLRIIYNNSEERSLIRNFINKYGTNKIIKANRSSYKISDDIVKLTENADISEEELAQELEHEIVHQLTTAYIGMFEDVDPDIKYVKENIQKLKDASKPLLKRIKDPAIKRRLERIIQEPNETTALAEALAIFKAEPEVFNTLGSVLKDNSLLGRIKRLLNKMSKWFNTNDIDMDMTALSNAIDRIVTTGSVFNNDVDAAKGRAEAKKRINADLKYDKNSKADKILDNATSYKLNKSYERKGNREYMPIEREWNMINNMFADSLESIMTYSEKPIENTASKADKWLYDNFDFYAKTKDVTTDFWNSSKPMQSMKGYLDRARVGDLMALNKLETIQNNAEKEVRYFEDTQIAKINKLISNAKLNGKELTDKDIKTLNKVVSQVPLFHLLGKNGDLQRILGSDNYEKEIEKMIKELVPKVGNRNKDAINLGLLLAKKKPPTTSSFYNIEQMKIKDGSRRDMERLVALYALKNTTDSNIGLDILNQNQELATELYVLSKSLKRLTEKVIGGTYDKKNFRENYVYEQFKRPKEFRAVDLRDINSEEYSPKKGWKVLRSPTNKEYGIVWRDRDKVTIQEGAGTTIDFKYYDIMVPEKIKMHNAANAVSVQNGTNSPWHKVVLTEEELDSFDDLISNPADSLGRAYGQMLIANETKAARDYITYGTKIKKMKSKSEANALNAKIRTMDTKKHPWFIKIPSRYKSVNEFFKDNPKLKNYYMVPERVSSINDFDKEFDLVRTDMHDMIMGYKDAELFEDNKPLRNIAFVIRQAVQAIKIHWIAVNPQKIANDIISNNVILSLKGVPFKDIAVNQAKSFKYMKEYSQMQNQIIMLEFQINGEDNKARRKLLEKKRDIIKKKMESHEFGPLYQNGMIQSMSTDLLRKDESVISGLQENIEKILNFGLKDKKGKSSSIEKALIAFSEWGGFGVDGVLDWAGKSIKNAKMLSDFGDQISEGMIQSGKRIKNKKNDQDMAKLISEFIASPDSEAVRLGSYLVQMTDVASRYTMFKYLMNNTDMSEEQAVLETIETFVDYKVNMPKELKALNDYGILLFPSFWLRIQKVIYTLVKENPAKVAAGITLSEMLNINVESYFDSNIIAKLGNGIIHQPPLFTDPLDAVIPTDLFQELIPFV